MAAHWFTAKVVAVTAGNTVKSDRLRRPTERMRLTAIDGTEKQLVDGHSQSAISDKKVDSRLQ